MSTQRSERIPEFTQGDRLRKARSLTGLTTREFADRIGVSHGTITSAEGDKRAVRPITLNAWAMATGVPVEWLTRGESSGPTPPQGTTNAAVDQLTERKRSRTRTTGQAAPTHRYVLAAA